MKLKLKKGLNLNIAGALPAGYDKIESAASPVCAICPDDFEGFTPKPAVKEGDSVAVGTPLLYDKNNNSIKLVSPVGGHVRAIVRGDRRKILRVEVEVGATEASSPALPKATDRASAKALLAESGLLAMMRRRPYAIIPDTADTVRDVFVSAMDTAPLAAPAAVWSAIFAKEDYESGIALLAMVTDGKVYLSHNASWTLGALKGAEMVEVEGAHPAGNPGVQAANIKPVNKGETIWTLDLPTLGRIGRLHRTGAAEARTVVAVTGPEVKHPALIGCAIGTAVEAILDGRLSDAAYHRRIISGNVLTGTAVDADAFLRYPYRQLTVIAEGDDKDEFMGWASMAPSKMSETRTFPGHFLSRAFRPDARLNGGRRAMIMSGQYDKVLPMDILPEYLIKAILSNNIEDMEKLGIYEVAPEDFAAAEYVDTSKLPLQAIVREGLDSLRKELE